jgi:hypothetical protein
MKGQWEETLQLNIFLKTRVHIYGFECLDDAQKPMILLSPLARTEWLRVYDLSISMLLFKKINFILVS